MQSVHEMLLPRPVPASLTLQDMVHQSGFPSSQETGDDSDWNFADVFLSHDGQKLRSAVGCRGAEKLFGMLAGSAVGSPRIFVHPV